MTSSSVRRFPPVDAGNGVTRQVLADAPELMVVQFTFGEGARGARHNHPHVQSTFVQSGRFEFFIGDEVFEVGPGDSFVIPSLAFHGCRAIEPGVLIDCFTPRRDDFL
ncbi:cupin domain-containing protein [Rhizobium paknamense]|uniref:Quercetin dioxygenase-like cupin family protein n=1 Tax=Rhizobium paknamense TaxID=1206817 RepID=A0ABU0ID23_9HYPH|nr:cupin domain-containing protein [Rhizobium paknamense]MDQ0456151.1 quercetin dioxygenase-like cupin family protein [Rhizobium paknamense]